MSVDPSSPRQVTPPNETVEFKATNPHDLLAAAAQWIQDERSLSHGWNVSYIDYDYGPALMGGNVEYTLVLHMECGGLGAAATAGRGGS